MAPSVDQNRLAEKIDRASKLPYYQQLYEILHRKIAQGEWRPGDTLPSETELIARYGVSRITIRQVLDLLVREGLIYRERGRGTFVAQPTLEKGMVKILSFTDDMRQRGLRPGTRILSAGLVPAAEQIAARLEIEPGEELVCLERLRLAEDEPLSIEESYLIHRYCPGLLQHDLEHQSLRELLVREYGVRWIRARQLIRSINASARTARLLGIRPGAALLYIERASYCQQDFPVEFLRIQYRGDRYTLYNELGA